MPIWWEEIISKRVFCFEVKPMRMDVSRTLGRCRDPRQVTQLSIWRLRFSQSMAVDYFYNWQHERLRKPDTDEKQLRMRTTRIPKESLACPPFYSIHYSMILVLSVINVSEWESQRSEDLESFFSFSFCVFSKKSMPIYEIVTRKEIVFISNVLLFEWLWCGSTAWHESEYSTTKG